MLVRGQTPWGVSAEVEQAAPLAMFEIVLLTENDFNEHAMPSGLIPPG